MPTTLDPAIITARRSPRVRSACAVARRRLARVAGSAWRHTRARSPAAWIHDAVRLDSTVEAGSGRYDVERRPWWKPILEAFADPEVTEISIAAATQIGKTLSLIALILWAAENAPAPAMLVTPDKDDAITLRDRLYINAQAMIRTGQCKHLRVPPEHLWNTRYIDLGSMRVYLAWSGSRQRLRGRPCRYVFCTEVAVYGKGMRKAGDPVAAAHQRTKAFFRGFKYHESSPSEHPCRITELEAASTARYRWQVPCPTCGTFQELRFFPYTKGALAGRGGFAGIKDAGGEYVSAETARQQAYYVCLNGCRIESSQKQAMLEAGRMVPFGCKVVRKKGKRCVSPKANRRFDADAAAVEIKGPQPASRRKLGFHLWSIHSESITFGDIASAYIEARQQLKVAEFFGNWLGLEYKPESRVPTWMQLGKRNAWTHARGTVPHWAWFLTAGADVQGENNGVRVTVRAWAPGRTSWLVDWRWLERDPGDDTDVVKSDLVKLCREVLERQYPVVDEQGRPASNPLGRQALGVKLLLVDSNHLPKKVHAWLKWLPASWVEGEQPRVRAIRGDHQLNPETRWQRSDLEQNVRTGEVYEGGMTVWRLYVYPFYDELTGLLSGDAYDEKGQPRSGAWYVTADCLTHGKAYLEQVVNFGRSVKLDEKTGVKKAVWGPRNHRVPIDFWDCEIYDLVAAEMVVGDLGWTAERWESWKRSRPAAARGVSRESKRSATLAQRDAGGLDDR